MSKELRELFEHLQDEHDLILVESEEREIQIIVDRIIQSKLEEAEEYNKELKSTSEMLAHNNAPLVKEKFKLIKENKELREALKEIERLCDNEYPSHELIWRIVYSILNQTENE